MQRMNNIERQKTALRVFSIYPKYLFYLFEGNNKTENANVYDYASMISPFISVSFVLKRK